MDRRVVWLRWKVWCAGKGGCSIYKCRWGGSWVWRARSHSAAIPRHIHSARNGAWPLGKHTIEKPLDWTLVYYCCCTKYAVCIWYAYTASNKLKCSFSRKGSNDTMLDHCTKNSLRGLDCGWLINWTYRYTSINQTPVKWIFCISSRRKWECMSILHHE